MHSIGSIFSLMRPTLARLVLLTPFFLTGCDTVVLNASGDVAVQQANLLIISTLLMLLIIVPVIFLVCLFAWKYRHTNQEAHYDPEWDHSTSLELVIWGAPLLIIIVLGLLTWVGTHTLDPYRKLTRLDAHRILSADVKPITIQVVALDWKWLFIYPDLGIATVNELAAPVDHPIEFNITASSIMNSFFIPALAGQIYAMPGMQTSLNAVMNRVGEFEGFSANYSGTGFSDMKFKFISMDADQFNQWAEKIKTNTMLSRNDYLALEKPSEREPVRYFGAVDPLLYHAILNRCVDDNQICMDNMMMSDMARHQGDYLRANPAKETTTLALINKEKRLSSLSIQEGN